MTDGGLRVLAGVFWGFMLRCGGRYEWEFSENSLGLGADGYARGSGKFTSGHGGWTYLSRKEAYILPNVAAICPREGELVEADGRRFKVTFADCRGCYLLGTPGATFPTPTTKVRVVCGALAQELLAVRTRACGAAGKCGAGHCVGMLAVGMLRTGVCVWGLKHC